jgi:polysaccharide export outer membrane protein
LVLQDGDRLIIPKQPASVAVLGQVYNPGALIYQVGRTVGDYLAKAGGPSQWADKDHILLIRANGEVLTDEGIRSTEKNRTFPLLPVISGGLMEAQLEPGDTIYVPEQLVYVSGLKYATDVTQIITNAAMSLAVVGILASSL